MTQRPRQLVNDGVSLTEPTLPESPTVDLPRSLDRVEALHGAAAAGRYRHFLGRALAAAENPDRDGMLTLAALSAWRAGAVGFRTDALRRLDLARSHGMPGLPALAAALGLAEDQVTGFAGLQRDSRYGWPGQAASGLIAVVGGFRGLFGPWLAPPRVALAGERRGSFLIRTGLAGAPGEEWLLSIDVFGHTLTRLPAVDVAAGQPQDGRWTGAESTAAGLPEAGAVGAVLRLQGYTAELHQPEPPA